MFISATLGYQPLSVLSGSMKPTLEPGDMIFVHKVLPNDVQVGDVITFRVDHDILITHRVVDVIKKNSGEILYKTKGDANQTADKSYISGNRLLGKMIWSIPKGGYISKWVRSRWGLFILILMPATVFMVAEVKRLKRLVRRSINL